MCQTEQTLYTICAHSIYATTNCGPHSLNPLNGHRRTRCDRHPFRHSLVVVGWCPSCEKDIRQAHRPDREDHYRTIKPYDAHIINNFWALRSARSAAFVRPLLVSPAILDQAECFPYQGGNAGARAEFTDEFLQQAHDSLKAGSVFDWNIDHQKSKMFDSFPLPWRPEFSVLPSTVPRMPQRITGECTPHIRSTENVTIDGTREEYALWFALYSFRPSRIYVDSRWTHEVWTAFDADSTAFLLSRLVYITRKWYAKDLGRDVAALEAEDRAWTKSRYRDCWPHGF